MQDNTVVKKKHSKLKLKFSLKSMWAVFISLNRLFDGRLSSVQENKSILRQNLIITLYAE